MLKQSLLVVWVWDQARAQTHTYLLMLSESEPYACSTCLSLFIHEMACLLELGQDPVS